MVASGLTDQEQVKRKRSNLDDREASNEHEGRKRGRPRVDPQTESAADRRRTQIRLAQRAYRQRKESTLDELRRQVSELQGTIRSMNQIFQEFSETCVSQDNLAPSHLTAELQRVSGQYTALVKNTQEVEQDSPPPMGEVERRLSAVNAFPKDVSETSLDGGNTVAHTTQAGPTPIVDTPAPVHVGWGYTENMDSLQIQGHGHATTYYGVGHGSGEEMLRKPPDDPVSRSLSQNMTLDLPYTYSFQETTFARRLHRASVELAYRLACDRTRGPLRFEQIFHIWKKYVPSIEIVKEQLRTCLMRGVEEPLSLWHFPLSHVGGSGTHYPRQEIGGGPWKPRPGPTEWKVRLPQAPTMAVGGSPEEHYDSQTAMLDTFARNPEYAGEWLDAYDVEGYLAEKGITIDPQSSFADAEMPTGEVIESEMAEIKRNAGVSRTSSTSGTGSGNISRNDSGTVSNASAHTLTTAVHNVSSSGYQYDGSFANFDMNYTTAGHSDMATGSFMNILPNTSTQPYIFDRSTAAMSDFNMGNHLRGPSNHDYMPPPPFAFTSQPMTRKVVLDVSKLIITLAKSGICLGRSPGFRRYEVDDALRECIMHDI
ncbi:hypothetical protein BDV97DRAFT_203408 [Delphinella strobiligena]|nr:hypothetical protein BDV97DRAFT_203408 [Delphinella strobiligena]